MVYIIQVNDGVLKDAFSNREIAVAYVEQVVIPHWSKQGDGTFCHPDADHWYRDSPFLRIAILDLKLDHWVQP